MIIYLQLNICFIIFFFVVKGNIDVLRKSVECFINELYKFVVRLIFKIVVDIVVLIVDKYIRDVMKQEIEFYVESERVDFYDLSKNKLKLK